MDTEEFDVVVVGGGVAGCVAAYQLAQQGREVVLIERGETPGSKNLSGGVFYCDVMEQVFPGFVQIAPTERHITRNCVTFLNGDSQVGIDYRDAALGEPVNAVTVLRAHMDAWLAEKCEEAGVMVMPGVRVDRLLQENGGTVGVVAGDDELRAKVVVAADGVNSFIAREAGLRSKPELDQLAVGVKSTISLGSDVIAQRFQLKDDEGAAFAVVGDCTQGVGGGGFMYTNRDSVSIGVVLRLDDLVKKGKASSDLHDHFLSHPFIAPYIEGGELLEYGCHLVAEGGQAMMGDLAHDGLVIVGDAAGLTLNTGLTVRGMDLAAGSAIAAAKAIGEALEAGDVSKRSLQRYVTELNRSFVGQDMQTYAKAPKFLENEAMYGQVGELAAGVMRRMFKRDQAPSPHLTKAVRAAVKSSGLSYTSLAKIGLQGMRAL